MESPRLLLLKWFFLLMLTCNGVPWPFSLLNCLISFFFFDDSGSDWICAYSCAKAASVGFATCARAVRSRSTKLNIVLAAVPSHTLSFSWNTIWKNSMTGTTAQKSQNWGGQQVSIFQLFIQYCWQRKLIMEILHCVKANIYFSVYLIKYSSYGKPYNLLP